MLFPVYFIVNSIKNYFNVWYLIVAIFINVEIFLYMFKRSFYAHLWLEEILKYKFILYLPVDYVHCRESY